MEGTELDPQLKAKLERLKKLEAKEAKQKRYQQVQNAKTNLRAKWAKQNNCPITKNHAEFYTDLDEQMRESLSIEQIMELGDSWNSESDAKAHAVNALQKGQSAETHDEPSALVG